MFCLLLAWTTCLAVKLLAIWYSMKLKGRYCNSFVELLLCNDMLPVSAKPVPEPMLTLPILKPTNVLLFCFM